MVLLWTAGIPPWVLAGLRPFDQSVDYHWGPITLLSTLDQEHTIEWSVVRIERLLFDSGLFFFFYWLGLCLRFSLDSRTIIDFYLGFLDVLWWLVYFFGFNVALLRSVSLVIYVSLDSRTIIGFDLWCLDDNLFISLVSTWPRCCF